MQFLPIVERELRVVARHAQTWWRRVLVLLLGFVVLAFIWLTAGRFSSLSQMGHAALSGLSVLGFIYALLAGPLATADCLIRERREGTLGLLFLTDLRGYDVVFGKIAASSLDISFSLVAALPLLAIPVLAGGVNLAQLGQVVLALANLMVLSLAIGVFASSLLDSGRAALAATFLALLFLTFGLPLVGEGVLKLRTNGTPAAVLYSCCPLWLIAICVNPPGFPSPMFKYWMNIAGTQMLAWALLSLACYRTGKHWREVASGGARSWWRGRFGRWRKPSFAAGFARRRFWLERNPVAWIERRDRWQERILAVLVCGCGIFYALEHAHSPRTWPRNNDIFLWPAITHYLLCLWVCIQSPRRFADDKQSGALELLLCTTLPARQFVRGAIAALWRRFGRALVALVLLDAFLVYAYVSHHGGWTQFRSVLVLCVGATAVFPLQGYVMALAGLYHGLAKANSLRATFTLIWTLGLLPWPLFAGTLLFCDLARRYLTFMPRISEDFVFLCWTGAHLVVFAPALARAWWELRHNLRELAAGTAIPWWKRAWQAVFDNSY